MQTSIIGYPRIGSNRELKFVTESYFKGASTEDELLAKAKELRFAHWKKQADGGIDFISSGDFSFYDGMLDTAFLLGIIPKRYRDLGFSGVDTYFAMAKGYQGEKGDVKALSMRKWFTTNYHYIVPEIEDDTAIALKGSKLFDEFLEAKAAAFETKPVVIGAFTFLKLATYEHKQASDFVEQITKAYVDIITRLGNLGAQWIQIDEPILVTDLTPDDNALFTQIYSALLAQKGSVKVLLQTYFGDIRDAYDDVIALPFDGIGLDFVEGKETLNLVKSGFSPDKTLFAGLVNGKNIWRNNYTKTLKLLTEIQKHAAPVVIGTSCSLLHVPYSIVPEKKLPESACRVLACAEEKLIELAELSLLGGDNKYAESAVYKSNRALHAGLEKGVNSAVTSRLGSLKESDYIRLPIRRERFTIQKQVFNLPLLPTTTIGSFPQTEEVRKNRTNYRKGNITKEQYEAKLRELTARVVNFQEEIGLDVLVHGEFERNDMVEYFGENLDGFLFTQFAWVQSYGTRCVKPPIVYGDISRKQPITVETSIYAQGLTNKPMKGMLTGPMTILNWSFPREDVSNKEQATQIALAIRDEVLDLEAVGITIIQIDEAALREKLPLRKSDWHREYLDWAIPVFRLTHSGVKPETQIHTHMCYSEFQDIICDIDAMDTDVITFEASRSSLAILTAIKESGFKAAVGPGVYDIHSPRVPSEEEIRATIETILQTVPVEKAWVNPDCGLKTRGNTETIPSLKNLVVAAKKLRNTLKV
ncbi:MAG: 5-methyltetrahydropteroyltriglutamate--homocysteine S-methyltransferase [Coriobacteriales bacterium]|jgi:5-methyltetrahydropteroyltriglutamate--homocysteine methyltransferase|nr:5-methyltetrahydropteroyltriglutamate--homocysteine S-methyltransferase [Coriobacteriales bacterium]